MKKVKLKINGKEVEGLEVATGKMNKHDSKIWDCAYELGYQAGKTDSKQKE